MRCWLQLAAPLWSFAARHGFPCCRLLLPLWLLGLAPGCLAVADCWHGNCFFGLLLAFPIALVDLDCRWGPVRILLVACARLSTMGSGFSFAWRSMNRHRCLHNRDCLCTSSGLSSLPGALGTAACTARHLLLLGTAGIGELWGTTCVFVLCLVLRPDAPGMHAPSRFFPRKTGISRMI